MMEGRTGSRCRAWILGITVVALVALPAAAEDCRVKIDRSINCDPIIQTDFGFEGPDGQVIESCMTPCDEPIKFKYRVDNAGEMTLLDCVVTDTNLSVSPDPLHIGDLDPGPGLWREIVGPVACSDGLDDAEPGTLMVVCGCVDSTGNEVEVSATDTAQFTCAGCQGGGGGEPGVMIMEICDPQVDGTNKINATVKNSGDLDLENCVVTARVYEGDGDCPGGGASTEVGQQNIPLLGVGSEENVMFEVDGLTADSCSEVDVVCDSGGGQASDIADDLCETPGGGCLTRTGGFWGTHPHIADLYVPVESCGLTVDNTAAATAVSSTEDICINNQEARSASTSMQQLQLIRQCTVAALNFSATADGEGNCEGSYPGIGDVFDRCCADLCTDGQNGNTISETGCIEQLDAFNNSDDTMDAFGPFLSPGPADPSICREAKGNRWVNPGRNLGPKSGGSGSSEPQTTVDEGGEASSSDAFGSK